MLHVAREGDARVMAKLAAGLFLAVRIARQHGWGTALIEETGSLQHLAEVSRLSGSSSRRSFATEAAWYAARGLPWIPPELREGRGECTAALENALPTTLIDLADIRGDLHVHTSASDGANALEEMVQAARARGYEYLAITDHSQSLKITNGLDESRLRAQMAAIDKLNASLKGFTVLKGSEVDILADGSLDFADSLLRRLDVVVASIHSRFALGKADQTQRLLKAIQNPYVTCIGHLTGRKLLRRPGYELDINHVLREIKRHRKLLEINASPDRLDVDDRIARQARELGIPLLVNSDAHSTRELDFIRFGVQQARRGWQTAETVPNTLPLGELKKRLAQTRSRRS